MTKILPAIKFSDLLDIKKVKMGVKYPQLVPVKYHAFQMYNILAESVIKSKGWSRRKKIKREL